MKKIDLDHLNFQYKTTELMTELDSGVHSELQRLASQIERSCNTLRRWENETENRQAELELTISLALNGMKRLGNRSYFLDIHTEVDAFQFDIMEFVVGSGPESWGFDHVGTAPASHSNSMNEISTNI